MYIDARVCVQNYLRKLESSSYFRTTNNPSAADTIRRELVLTPLATMNVFRMLSSYNKVNFQRRVCVFFPFASK